MTEEANLKGHNTAPNLQGNNRALSGHQSQGAEEAGALEEDTGISPEGYCRRFETGGSLSRRVNVSRAPAQMGRARGRARRGEARWPEMGVREVEIPRPSCSSRAQVGCACSRGLQASTRVREASGPKRAPVPSSSPRGQPSLRRPWSFLL